MRFSAYEAGKYATNGKYMHLPARAAAFKYGICLMKRKKALALPQTPFL